MVQRGVWRMKKISVLIPCYNEEENVGPMSEALVNMFKTDLPDYDYEIVFIDNDSRDLTRPRLRQICNDNPKIKAIFNARNFGQNNSPYYGILQTTVCVVGTTGLIGTTTKNLGVGITGLEIQRSGLAGLGVQLQREVVTLE